MTDKLALRRRPTTTGIGLKSADRCCCLQSTTWSRGQLLGNDDWRWSVQPGTGGVADEGGDPGPRPTHAPCATHVPPPRHPRRLPFRRNPKLATFDIVNNTLLGSLTLDPAGMHCPAWDDAFVSSSSLFHHQKVATHTHSKMK